MKLAAALLALSSRLGAASASSSSDDCPAPGGPGPYNVGFSGWQDPSPSLGFTVGQFALADMDRSLGAFDCSAIGLGAIYPNGCIPFDVWFPTDDITGTAPVQYPLSEFVSLTLGESYFGAAPSTAKDCFPAVVYSHGSFNSAIDSFELVQTLASKGYVVIAPTHVGNTAVDFTPEKFGDISYLLQAGESRQRDISPVLDAVLGSPLGASICEDKIAIIGPSLGAFTALAAANGLTTIENIEQALAGTAGPIPNELLADDRIKAVVAMAPSTALFPGNPATAALIGTLGLSDLAGFLGSFGGQLKDLIGSNVPTLLLPAEKDQLTPIGTDTVPLWNTIQCTTEKTYRADIEGAGHAYPGSGCAIIDQIVAQSYQGLLGGLSSLPANPSVPIAFKQQLQVFLQGIPALSSLSGDAILDVADICSQIDPASLETLFLSFELGALVDTFVTPLEGICEQYFGLLPSYVSSGCFAEEDACAFFADIKEDLDQNTDPAYKATVEATLVYGSPFGVELSLLDQCAAIDLPTLSGDDALDVVATYVTAYLDDIFGGDCYDDVLEEEYAVEEGLPVDQLFLEDFVEDVCELSSGSEDESVRNLRARKAS